MTTSPHDHHDTLGCTGDVDGDGYCALHGFKPIGEASTWNGLLAIVAPYYATTLGQWWDQFLEQDDATRRQFSRENSHEILLEQTTYSVTCPEGYKDSEQAMLVSCQNGYYAVEARYCDELDTGHMSICELRIRLHPHDLADEVKAR